MANKIDVYESKFVKFISRALRRASYMWGPRTDALKVAKVAWGKYTCAYCKETHSRKDIQIDHIEPVVPVTGFTTWDEHIERLFCPQDGFQILCKPCHKIKTKEENSIRRTNP